ncbi:hypothetical protein EJ08DRAFT_650714 [Tothia fuscella]|uniref:Uncharacterized protein n=1 Tax=Tothia fuscella TaxID=1048955 RepID=A0A9P4TW66_9PEZI|nr:hypothetical protein EJ08DRAFT_650714 [Tothia fuscella]
MPKVKKVPNKSRKARKGTKDAKSSKCDPQLCMPDSTLPGEPKPQAKTPSSFPFMRLPAEIRKLAYIECLKAGAGTRRDGIYDHGIYASITGGALFNVCRQVRYEALYTYFETGQFNLESSCKGTTFFKYIGPVPRSALKEIKLPVPLTESWHIRENECIPYFNLLPTLQSLELQIDPEFIVYQVYKRYNTEPSFLGEGTNDPVTLQQLLGAPIVKYLMKLQGTFKVEITYGEKEFSTLEEYFDDPELVAEFEQDKVQYGKWTYLGLTKEGWMQLVSELVLNITKKTR